jgi:hypothetical protein
MVLPLVIKTFIFISTIWVLMKKEFMVILVLCIVNGYFFDSDFSNSNVLGSRYGNTGMAINKLFNITDIPTWAIGDTWTYESSVFFYGENGSFDGLIENCVQTVVEIVNLTQNQSVPFYVVNLSGDISGELTYEWITGDLEGAIQGELAIRISDLAVIRSEVESWGTIEIMPLLIFDYGLNSRLLFQPPLENYDFPLKLNETWEVLSNISSEGNFYIGDLINESLSGHSLMSGIMEFVGIEDIIVPAGIFECCQLNSHENGSFNYWFSPIVKNSIKSVINMSDNNSTLNLDMNLTSYSLMNQQINITQNLIPPSVYAKEYVNITGFLKDTITGNAIPNASIFLRLPYWDRVWEATTNELGCYHTMILTPLINDDTPSDGDIGSEGIIAWTLGGYGTGYRIATLTVRGVKHTYYLPKGWNLISKPTENIWTAESLGRNITGCSLVLLFNASTQEFMAHVVGNNYDDFPIRDGAGYFIRVSNDTVFECKGRPIPSVNVTIYEGWNTLGWYHDYPTNAQSLGENTSASLVLMYNATTQEFMTYVMNSGYDNFIIMQGMAVFIQTIETGWWQGEG